MSHAALASGNQADQSTIGCKPDRDPYHAAIELILNESANPYPLFPALTQTFGEAATEDAYQMACSHLRACGLMILGVSALVVAFLRALFHATGYLTDENAPLRNSPAVVGSYMFMSMASTFIVSFGLYCMQSNKRAMEMRKHLHNCTRAAVIVTIVPCSLLMWLTCSLRHVAEWEWYLLGAFTFTMPFLLSAMRLSIVEAMFPTILLLSSLLAPASSVTCSLWHIRPVLGLLTCVACLLWYLCWLEQSHRGAFLSKLQVVRLQAELQVSEMSRLEERTHSLLSVANRKRQEADLERAKIQLMSMTCAPSEHGNMSESLRQIAKVDREPLLKKAWEWSSSRRGTEVLTSNPKFPCVAITSTNDIHYLGRSLSTKGVIGGEKPIRAGSHSFVKVPGETYLRVSTIAKTFGSCPGHPTLASEYQVQYAGEIEFDENQHITRWSNMSGTYQCPDNTAFQAGLPLDKFYAVRTGTEVRLSGGLENNPWLFQAENGVVLEKILSFTEEAFIGVQASWNQHQIAWLASTEDARECHERLIRMMRQLQAAISKYGYLSKSNDVWPCSNPEEENQVHTSIV